MFAVEEIKVECCEDDENDENDEENDIGDETASVEGFLGGGVEMGADYLGG